MTEKARMPLRSGGCTIIGEVGQAHDGSLGLAHAFIDAIADAGADAVKFQTHIAAAESTRDEPWRVRFSRQDASRYDYWRRMEFSREQWTGLRDHAEERGLWFLSSPFSLEAVELLEDIGLSAWKIASGEVGNIPLIRRVAESGWPVIISSGMSTVGEIDAAVELVRAAGVEVAVLQCTSEYPVPPEKVGLNVIPELRARYGVAVGLSDHSGSIFAGLAGAVLGIDLLEVHVTLSREMFGPDVAASITTAELKTLVEGIRCIERMIANPVDKNAIAEDLSSTRMLFTKSVVAREDLPAGTILQEGHLTIKKPGTGIPAARLTEFLGRRLTRAVARDELLVEEAIE